MIHLLIVRLEEEEMKKLVDQRKREKEEERLARERVKAQIEADRAARRAKQTGAEPPPPLVQIQPVCQNNAVPVRDYAQTKIQVRSICIMMLFYNNIV